MNGQPAAPSMSAPALLHAHGGQRCACEEQSLNAVPWILAASVALLALNWFSGRRKAARSKTVRG